MSERVTRVGNYYIRRPQAQPASDSWKRDLREGLLMVPVLLALYLGVPFILWLAVEK